MMVAERTVAPVWARKVTFIGSNQLPPDAWLVPTNGIESGTAGVGTIQLLRGKRLPH
ncbi:MAG: hypothetical protein R3E79_57135 [Caldilineaceae bacterium]